MGRGGSLMPMSRGAQNKAAGNRAERAACRWALAHTSGLHDAVKDIATPTGRVGNYANLEIDGVFVEYSLESKSHKRLPEWLRYGIVDQAIAASKRFKNHPLVVLYSKSLPVDYRVWHVITDRRHAELLSYEKRYKAAEADKDLMIRKFDEDLANAIDSWEAGQRT
jgi:hypothetical protein